MTTLQIAIPDAEILVLWFLAVFAREWYITHPTATVAKWLRLTVKVSKEVNKKSYPKKTMVQLSTLYTDPEHHNAQRYRQMDRWTDRRTDDSMMPTNDHTV